MNPSSEFHDKGDSGRSIGAILIDNGRLSPEAAERILKLQKDKGLRFGDAAIQLGLVSAADIEQALSHQYDYPYLSSSSQVSDTLVAAFKPFSPVVEQLRALRSQLMLRWFGSAAANKTLAVVSPESSEGRSFVAANLAVVFSQLGERTLLIDADLRQPVQHQFFGLNNKQGLSSVLAGRSTREEAAMRIPDLMNLTVLPAGPQAPNPLELLSRPQFSALLAQCGDDFDIVIVDTPPAAPTADAQTICARTRGALIVTRRDISRAASLRRMTLSLQQDGVHLVGTLLNNG